MMPLVVRAERHALHLTAQSIELACGALAERLAGIEAELAEPCLPSGVGAHVLLVRTALVADRIALIDALAELRGQR